MKIENKLYELPKKFKEKWVKALRSGKYTQNTRGALNDVYTNTNCCLGVACLISGIALTDLNNHGYPFDTINNIDKLPKILQGDSNNILVKKLVTMNDSGKWSFKRLATYIEKYL